MGTKNGYDVSERTYKWWYDNIESRYYNLMVAYCFLPFGGEKKARSGLIDEVTFQPGERILDMCCGTGNATFITAEKAPADVRITGIDLSAGQIRVATRRNRFANADFIVADATSIDFPDCAFDKVFILFVLVIRPARNH
jgi:ubiquinone/menaquinone biosynthesis C-methylase UbiE